MQPAQTARIAALMGEPQVRDEWLDRVLIDRAPFDLPDGYVLVRIRGVVYGIAPNGIASS